MEVKSCALVTETYPPEVNGVSMTLGRLVSGLRAHGLQVEVVRPYPQDGPRVVPGERRVWGFPIPRYSGLRFGFPSFFGLYHHWHKTRPDWVHVATEGPLGIAALWAAKALSIPVTSSYHTNFHSYSSHYGVGLFQRVVWAYLRWFHNATRITLAPTLDLCESLRKAGFRKVDRMGRGVDLDLYNPNRRSEALRSSWGVKEGERVLLHVGRIAAEKNLPLLFRAWEVVRDQVPGWKMVVVGDGPMRPQLQQQHPGVIFTGKLGDQDLADHYASADLFVFPSLTETFGNVVTEALASGLPVVAYNYAAPALHVTHGSSGGLAPCNDEEAFLLQVREWSQRLLDPQSLQEASAAAHRAASDLSWDHVVKGFLRSCQQAIGSDRS